LDEGRIEGSVEADQGMLDDSNYVRAVNALQRLYFTVMKDGIGPCMHGALVGLRTFIKLIRMVFREGLYVLLSDSVRTCDVKTELPGVDTILAIYGDSSLDFRWITDMVFSILHPLDSELQSGDYAQVQWIIKQPLVRINALIQRLMLDTYMNGGVSKIKHASSGATHQQEVVRRWRPAHWVELPTIIVTLKILRE